MGNETQAHFFTKGQEARKQQVVTEESRVRLMYGINVASVTDSSVMFTRASDGRNLELGINPTAAPLLKSMTSKPTPVKSLPCTDQFERLCILQMLLEHGVVQRVEVGPP